MKEEREKKIHEIFVQILQLITMNFTIHIRTKVNRFLNEKKLCCSQIAIAGCAC